MSKRIAKVNSLIQRTFAEILHEEADIPRGVMVTVARVETKPNLQSSTIWLYISPLEMRQETLLHLEKQLYDLQGALNRALHMRPLPRIYLKLDTSIDNATAIEEKLSELKKDTSG